jgi:hypothetical protein
MNGGRWIGWMDGEMENLWAVTVGQAQRRPPRLHSWRAADRRQFSTLVGCALLTVSVGLG